LSKAGAKIVAGLEDAVAGNLATVTIEGQRWVRVFGFQPQVSEWQTIESAPIGRTSHDKILVGFMGQFHWVPFVAFPNGPETQSPGHAKPTHWMPIPTPPVTP
jgi:hypothetical protein